MDIKKDKNIWKFSFYGFFKNLKFFEPFLYVYFLSIGLTYFQIGTLISIREVVKNVWEVPSGIFADHYGRKSAMKICFVLYIISFIIFYFGYNFLVIIPAMIFFGTGEAFRSGTHKAIIFTYVDYINISDKKACIGRGLFAIRSSNSINYKYLYYFFLFFFSKSIKYAT
mgnify:CR=1 FL=1